MTIVVAVSGGMDPIHIGHIRHFKEAKKLGDKLIVFLQTDEWLKKKKVMSSCLTKKEKKSS